MSTSAQIVVFAAYGSFQSLLIMPARRRPLQSFGKVIGKAGQLPSRSLLLSVATPRTYPTSRPKTSQPSSPTFSAAAAITVIVDALKGMRMALIIFGS